MAADWPDLDELKRALDVTSDDYDGELESLMDAAISRVKQDVGNWVEGTDIPSPALARAALRAAVLLQPNTAEAQLALGRDPVYQSFLKGKRRVFGFA